MYITPPRPHPFFMRALGTCIACVAVASVCLGALVAEEQNGDEEPRGGAAAAPPRALPFPSPIFQVWMCLEYCPNGTKPDVRAELSTLRTLVIEDRVVNAVSYEHFTIGAGGVLVAPTALTDITTELVSIRREQTATMLQAPPTRGSRLVDAKGFSVHRRHVVRDVDGDRLLIFPMVSGHPYTNASLEHFRSMLRNPLPFINALSANLTAMGVQGVNIDFELQQGVTRRDARMYAAFLRQLRAALGQPRSTRAADGDGDPSSTPHQGQLVTVDAAAWSLLWNFSELSAAMGAVVVLPGTNLTVAAGSVMTMSTYAASRQGYEAAMAYANTSLSRDVWTVGLWSHPLTNVSEVQFHFALLAEYGVCRVAIWRLPLAPALWQNETENFWQRCRHS